MECISVIIPVYNPGKHLYRCLDSIIGQTWKNLDIILINDGSTDDSLSVCRSYAEKDSRITVIDQDNRGVSVARNRGMEIAKGDYFSFIDSDDYIEPDTYAYLIDIFHREQTDIVAFEYYTTFPNRETAHRFKGSHYGKYGRKEAMYRQAYGVPFSCVKLFRRSVVENLRFVEGLARGEDGDFARRAIHNAESVYFDSRPLLHYVQSEESAVRGEFRPNQLTILDVFDRMHGFYVAHYPELANHCAKSFLHIAIGLYCDICADKRPLCEEKNIALEFYRSHKKFVTYATWGEKVKFCWFSCTPRMFAWVHNTRTR